MLTQGARDSRRDARRSLHGLDQELAVFFRDSGSFSRGTFFRSQGCLIFWIHFHIVSLNPFQIRNPLKSKEAWL